jgi:hypothetical protein
LAVEYVFVAIKNTFDSEEAEQLKGTAEIIWAKLTLPSGSKLYISSMYHPHTANTASMDEIQRNRYNVLSPLVGLFTSWFNPQFGVSSINSWWISAFLLFSLTCKKFREISGWLQVMTNTQSG